jgi:hypothetical protein
MLRDQEVAWPWYDGSAAAIRKITPRLDPVRMHRRLVDTLKQYQSYAMPIVAACDTDLAGALNGLSQPVILPTVSDDARYAAAAVIGAGTKIVRPADVTERAQAFAQALA